jgi:hypothetical protein
MAGDAGIEPAHVGVKVQRLPTWQIPQKWRCMGESNPPWPLERRISLPIEECSMLERARGLEPRSPVWKTGALPLSYARELAEGRGFEPRDPLRGRRFSKPLH